VSKVTDTHGSSGNAAARAAAAHIGAAFLAQPAEHSHAVQFYEDEDFLFDTVAQFLKAGLLAGDRLLVVATPAHRDGFVQRLAPFRIDEAVESGQVLFVDAWTLLTGFMIGDMPDPDLFRDALSRLLTKAKDGAPPRARVRAYGEMVDILWRNGNSKAAIRLEELWNEAGQCHDFALLCAYLMGNFYKEGDAAQFLQVCRNHSHVIPAESFSQLDDADARLREISLLQQRARALETEIQHRKDLERALREALRERSRAEEELRACVVREQEARAQAVANDRFKEVFLGMLGHELRNPLNTVLTTVRLMTMRSDLPGEAHKRLGRVVSSGLRMQRMIDQLLDITRARLAGGIPVQQGTPRNVAPLVVKIVEEARLATPDRSIEIDAEESCVAAVDDDRFEQVVANLVGNAVTHGDPLRPVSVRVSSDGASVTVSVHNFGAPIDRAFLPLLFDPFKRGEKPQQRSAGLGLGLYISERIVRAHGGTIQVESTPETGTRFEASFPRSP
jgi:signal transduction histidine kinase